MPFFHSGSVVPMPQKNKTAEGTPFMIISLNIFMPLALVNVPPVSYDLLFEDEFRTVGNQLRAGRQLIARHINIIHDSRPY